MAKGEYNEAENYFLRALKITPNYYTLHINLGVLYDAKGDKILAEKHYKKSYRSWKKLSLALVLLRGLFKKE